MAGEKWRMIGLMRTHGVDPQTQSYWDMAMRCKVCAGIADTHHLTREEVDNLNTEVVGVPVQLRTGDGHTDGQRSKS